MGKLSDRLTSSLVVFNGVITNTAHIREQYNIVILNTIKSSVNLQTYESNLGNWKYYTLNEIDHV